LSPTNQLWQQQQLNKYRGPYTIYPMVFTLNQKQRHWQQRLQILKAAFVCRQKTIFFFTRICELAQVSVSSQL